ncbi:hypothetical protein HHI36_003583 [Cryptolaemus montrouzieri]|uniref:Chemosensory protein n=1 Tax=Cryptolaemus montrouzieri TaxID=559131 RepID=A0ABD2PET1_9CUCU
MNSIVFFMTSLVVCVYSGEPGKYTSKFNNIDLDAVMANHRLIIAYFNCLMSEHGQGCSPDALELRRVIPEVLEDGCAKCSPTHIEAAKVMTNFLITKKPDIFKKLLQKYDPDKKYRKRWDAQLRAAGFDPDKF